MVGAACGGGDDDQADAPECPPVSTTAQPTGTTPTTVDPRCIQGADEREVWEGTMNHTVTAPYAGPCGSPFGIPGTARFVVEPNGDVAASYDVAGCGVSEPHAEFTGTATDEGFSFPELIVQTNGERIPKVSPTRAQATLANLQGPAGLGTQWVTEWDMRCVNC